MAEGASVGDRVKQAVVQALGLEVGAAEIADDEVLFGGGLGADSVATLEIVFALEEEFGFEVDDDDLRVELFDSVRSLTEYVEATLMNAEARRPTRRPDRRRHHGASEDDSCADTHTGDEDAHRARRLTGRPGGGGLAE